MKLHPLIALSFLALTLLALGALMYGSTALMPLASERARELQTRIRAIDKSTQTQRIHTAVEETTEARAVLDAFVRPDIVATAQLLEDTGRRAGVSVKVANAAQHGNGTTLPGGDILRPVLFSLAAEGSLAALLKAVQLYERLPLAARVTQLQFTRTDDAAAGKPWHLEMQLQILAIAAL